MYKVNLKFIVFCCWFLDATYADFSFETYRNVFKETLAQMILDIQEGNQEEASRRAGMVRIQLEALSKDEKREIIQRYQELIQDFQNQVSQDTYAQNIFDEIVALKDMFEGDALLMAIKDKLAQVEPSVIKRVVRCVMLHVTAPGLGNVLESFKNQLTDVAEQSDALSCIVGIEGCIDFQGSNDMLAAVIMSSSFKEAADAVSSVIIKQIQDSQKPVVVDCYATWCPPCRMMKPIFERLAEKYKDEFMFLAVNVDEAIDFSRQYDITGMPTFLFIKNGEVVDRHIGSSTAQVLENKINTVFY